MPDDPHHPKPIPVDDEGFATGEVPDGIYGEDRAHAVDIRVSYEDNDDMPPPMDVAAFIEVTLAVAIRDGQGPFPGNLDERERIAKTVSVGLGDATPPEGLPL